MEAKSGQTITLERPAVGAAAAPPPPRRRRGVLVVAGIITVILAVVGRLWWVRSHEVSTDDAQMQGHIVPVAARVGGYVQSVRVQDNGRVRAGDTLVVLDDRDLRSRLAQADAELDALIAAVGTQGRGGQALAQLAGARASAAGAQAAVVQADAAAAKAANDLQRYQGLAATNIVSRQQLDAAETAVRTTTAQLDAARRNADAAAQQVVSAEAGLRGADARVEASRAARDQIALQLGYTRIIAPASGVISHRSVEPGQNVQPGQPLMSLVPLDSIWAVANLKETDIGHIRIGDPADVRVDAYPGHHFEGEVESISPATGAVFSLLPPDNATGNFVKTVQRIPVRIRLTQPQDPAMVLRPGMSVDVTLKRH